MVLNLMLLIGLMVARKEGHYPTLTHINYIIFRNIENLKNLLFSKEKINYEGK
jgi:hypothetical protein